MSTSMTCRRKPTNLIKVSNLLLCISVGLCIATIALQIMVLNDDYVSNNMMMSIIALPLLAIFFTIISCFIKWKEDSTNVKDVDAK